MSKIIFYFSGTGNSYAVAKSVAEKTGDTSLDLFLNATDYELEKFSMIGFVFPVYYTHAPKIALEVLKKLDFHQGQHLFVIASYGSSWGYAIEEVRSIIEENGSSPQEFKVRMPGNYILEYGALPKLYQYHTLRRSVRQAGLIAAAITEKKNTGRIKPNLLARLFQKRADRKRKLFKKMGARFYSTEQCSHCSQCIAICPACNITLYEGQPTWNGHCEQCMACIQWCPQDAISHPDHKRGRLRYTHPENSVEEIFQLY